MLPHAPRCMNQLIPRRGRAVHRRLGWKSWALQPRDSFLLTCRCWMLTPRPPARCNIGLEVALPWQRIRAPASSRPDADTQTLTGSQQAKRMLSADQICTFNRSLNTKRRHGSVFGCQVFPDSHFRLFFKKKKKSETGYQKGYLRRAFLREAQRCGCDLKMHLWPQHWGRKRLAV